MREWLTTALDVAFIALSIVGVALLVASEFGVAAGTLAGALTSGAWSFVITWQDTRGDRDGDA